MPRVVKRLASREAEAGRAAPFRSSFLRNFPNLSTNRLLGRNGFTRSNSTAIVWPRG
jgi:hypothetical protein